jgi:cardiolipin synthase (CMP-forming)
VRSIASTLATGQTRSRFDAVEQAVAKREVDTIWTIPNLFTLIRLLCLPLFLWLLFGLPSRQAAAWLLGGLCATDWVDGYLARRLGQTSEFGKKFDPTVDRLLFIVAIIAIIIDGAAPVWFCWAVLIRELLVGGTVAVATVFFHMPRFDVIWWGKLGTALLLGAVPAFVVGSSGWRFDDLFWAVGWIVGLPGLIISWITAFLYMGKIRNAIATGRAAESAA